MNVELKPGFKAEYRKGCIPMNRVVAEEFEVKLRELDEAGITEPSNASIHVGCIPVPKKSGQIRPTVDLKPLNNICKKLLDYVDSVDTVFHWFSSGKTGKELYDEKEDSEIQEFLGISLWGG